MPTASSEAPEAETAIVEEVDAFMDQEMKRTEEEEVAPATEDGNDAIKKVPSTVAAMDTSLAPSVQVNVQKQQYIAVRVGYATCPSRTNESNKETCHEHTVIPVRNAIFMNWEDAKALVEFEKEKMDGVAVDKDVEGGGVKAVPFHSNVEWRAFDKLVDAEMYLRKVMPDTTVAAPPQTKEKIVNRNKTVTYIIKRTAKKTKKGKTKYKIVMRVPCRNRGAPTKKWLQLYDQAKAYKSSHDNLEVLSTDTENATLFKWIKYQRDSYRLYLEDPIGGQHSMTKEKVKMLSELGFSWIDDDKKAFASGAAIKTGKRGRPRKLGIEGLDDEEDDDDEDQSPAIRQKWMEMYEKLKTYVEQHGTTDIPKDTEDMELLLLRNWCGAQRSGYSKMQRGVKSKGMNLEKVDLLTSIGFNFPPNWSVMYSKLAAYKNDHGHLRVTEEDDAELASWVSRQNEVLGRHLHAKGTRLSDDQVAKLLDLGMAGGRKSLDVQMNDSHWNARWNEMFLKLRAYKAENGHCNPPTTTNDDLSNWVAAQRRMYNKLVQGKPGKRAVLDASKMQRLTELGFQFRPRGSYLTWDDQMEKLQKFVQENGHCKVPVSNPVLGSFVKLARREYKLKQQGKKSSMTEDRERDLTELGFVFEGGKTPRRSEGGNKSWDERFTELLIFKEENGHTIVPQNSGRLGQWVHSQRVNYKKMKDGKPTSMTAEKALKLTEIGFCFNASDRFRGNQKQEEEPQNKYPMYAEVPQLPPTEYAWRGRYTE